MKDNAFKKLEHHADEFNIVTRGTVVSVGYKPDCMLQNGNQYIILESETGTNRKMFLGGMIKASMFLRNEKTGRLAFVIKEHTNTKDFQIANHLKIYYEWIKISTDTNL